MHGNRINLEDNSEDVKIGRAIHEKKAYEQSNAEISIENIKVDKITKDYIVEIKKSDADVDASKWQLLYYIYILKSKGIYKKGKLEFVEKNKQDNKIIYIELTDDIEKELLEYIRYIKELIGQDSVPNVINNKKCKKCAYYMYCYI